MSGAQRSFRSGSAPRNGGIGSAAPRNGGIGSAAPRPGRRGGTLRPSPGRLLGAALAAALVGSGCAPPPEPGAPNLVLISVDTLRPDFLGSYGYPRETSPAIDALAADGVLFETAVSPAPWTLPSHASLLTGLYPSRHGATHERAPIREDAVLMAERLRERGWTTAAFVNAAFVSERYGFARGFGHFEREPHGPKRRAPSRIPERAEAWLAEAPEEPFFLFLHLFDVHSDYASLPAFEARFTRPYSGAADGSTAQLRRFREGGIAFDARDRAHLMDLYAAGVRQVDDSIARILAALAARGLDARTVVVLTSDHGEEFLEHGGVLHGRTLYEELVGVPLILRGPGLPAGRRIATPVSLVDVVPTLLHLAGVPVPDGLDGVDLVPLLRGEGDGALRSRVLFAEADHGNAEPDVKRMARVGALKLRRDRLSGETVLHDLSRDPGERTDASAERSAVAEDLRQQLDAFERGARGGGSLPALEPDEIERLRALGYL